MPCAAGGGIRVSAGTITRTGARAPGARDAVTTEPTLSRTISVITPARIGFVLVIALEAAVLLNLGLPARTPAVDGVLVRESDVSLEVTDQSAWSSVTLDRVLTPTDAWVVVQAVENGEPGRLVGARLVEKGESRNVTVRVSREPALPSEVAVTLVTDRGRRGQFESSLGELPGSTSTPEGMAGGEMGAAGAAEADGEADSPVTGEGMPAEPDKPLLVSGAQVFARARLTEFGIDTRGVARMDAASLSADGRTVTVSRVAAPVDSWVAITSQTRDEATLLRAVKVRAGESVGIEVPLGEDATGQAIMAWLHADLAESGIFDFEQKDSANSPDPAYFDGTWYVAVPVEPSR